jgi:hypothetical protein
VSVDVDRGCGISIHCDTVYRVNWLRAKARYAQWVDEEAILQREMIWTIESFKTMEKKWTKRKEDVDVDHPNACGLISYAAKQAALWHRFAVDADRSFSASHIRGYVRSA